TLTRRYSRHQLGSAKGLPSPALGEGREGVQGSTMALSRNPHPGPPPRRGREKDEVAGESLWVVTAERAKRATFPTAPQNSAASSVPPSGSSPGGTAWRKHCRATPPR